MVPQVTKVFETMGQDVTSRRTIVARFRFPKLKADSVVTHRFQVSEDCKDAMVIGREWDEHCLQVNIGGVDGTKSETLDTESVEE